MDVHRSRFACDTVVRIIGDRNPYSNPDISILVASDAEARRFVTNLCEDLCTYYQGLQVLRMEPQAAKILLPDGRFAIVHVSADDGDDE